MFLETNCPKSTKKQKSILGVGDGKIAGTITEELGIPCMHTDVVPEIFRGLNFDVVMLNLTFDILVFMFIQITALDN